MSILHEQAGQPTAEPQTILRSYEAAITESALETLEENSEYRPDFSKINTMTYVQQELAVRGLETVMEPLYVRGDKLPVSYRLTKTHHDISTVAQLNDYR